jgi:hypothetical protein
MPEIKSASAYPEPSRSSLSGSSSMMVSLWPTRQDSILLKKARGFQIVSVICYRWHLDRELENEGYPILEEAWKLALQRLKSESDCVTLGFSADRRHRFDVT